MNPKNKLVTVYVARGEAEAQIIKGLLESYGIASLLKPFSSYTANVFVTDGMGQVRVMVSPDDEKDARELLKGEDNAEMA